MTLEELRLRRRARLVYEHDLNVPWRHELRLEDRVEPRLGRSHPFCVQGHAPCPPEEVGGPEGCQVRREAWLSCEAMEDLEDLAEMLKAIVLDGRHELLDEQRREAMRDLLDRMRVREEWKGAPFSRKAVNARLRAPRPHASAVVTPGRSRAIRASAASKAVSSPRRSRTWPTRVSGRRCCDAVEPRLQHRRGGLGGAPRRGDVGVAEEALHVGDVRARATGASSPPCGASRMRMDALGDAGLARPPRARSAPPAG